MKSFLSYRAMALALLVIGAGLWFWRVQANDAQRVQAMLAQPRVDDFYFIDMRHIQDVRDRKYPYTALRLLKVDGEQLLLRVGNIYHSEQVSPWHHFKADAAMQHNFYSRYTLSITTDTLRSLAHRGVIYAMRRPQNLSSDGWVVLPRAAPGTEMPRLKPFVDNPEYRIAFQSAM